MNYEIDPDLFTVRSLVQHVKLCEAIGASIEAKLKNVPENVTISRKRSLIIMQFGKIVKAYNGNVKRYKVYLDFSKSEDPEGNVYEIDRPMFSVFSKKWNYGFFTVKDGTACRKRLGRLVSGFLEANGIKLGVLSKAILEVDTRTENRLFNAWLDEKE